MNGDGLFDQFAQYRYDSSGNRISSAEDFNGNGIADKYWSKSFETTSLSNPWDAIFGQF
ncbi:MULTISPECIES: hypothetical protein [unclassified Oleiphilus]|uniref:hypothetical protein n=1 Tax=unclassified Oleiphilus TaxID=2631174 RepID=UPI000A4B3F6D|nr:MULTISPECIES: hypothetical protein [unclassified Oleiphilus]